MSTTKRASTHNGGGKEPPSKQAKLDAKAERKPDPTQFLSQDIWMQILSFVGPGHFYFVAGVSHQLKENYEACFSSIDNPPKVSDGWSRRPAHKADTFYSAAFSSFSCAQLWEAGRDLRRDQVCCALAGHGNLAVLKWARPQGFPWDSVTSYNAATKADLEILKYAHENGCPWNELLRNSAARNGHLGCFKYAHENGCTWDDWTCHFAASKGQLDCLKYAHDNACTWNALTCCWAVEAGQLECLKYLHENDCPWDIRVCFEAAGNGHYAHENGCSWDKDTCKSAAQKGHLECLTYAYEKGRPWDEDTCSSAAAGGIWNASNTPVLKDVGGTSGLILWLQKMGMMILQNGPRIMAAQLMTDLNLKVYRLTLARESFRYSVMHRFIQE